MRVIRCAYGFIWSITVSASQRSKRTLSSVSTLAMVPGITGASRRDSSAKAVTATEQTRCKSASRPACFEITHGALVFTYSLTRSASAMIWRSAREYSRPSNAAPTSLRSARIAASSRSPSAPVSRVNLPSKRLLKKPAQRLTIFTYLPIRSELTRAMKSSPVKSTSSTAAFILAAR